MILALKAYGRICINYNNCCENHVYFKQYSNIKNVLNETLWRLKWVIISLYSIATSDATNRRYDVERMFNYSVQSYCTKSLSRMTCIMALSLILIWNYNASLSIVCYRFGNSIKKRSGINNWLVIFNEIKPCTISKLNNLRCGFMSTWIKVVNTTKESRKQNENLNK